MKNIVAAALLLASQASFSASTLECMFGIKRNGANEVESSVKSIQLIKNQDSAFTIEGETSSYHASIDFEIADLGYKISVSANTSNVLGSRIEADISDLRSGSLSRVKGKNNLHAELSRSDSYGVPAEGAAAVCSLK